MRRAAGTETTLDVLLRWVWMRRRSAEGDRADLDAGETLLVAGFSKSLGGERLVGIGKGRKIAVTRRGQLRLTAGESPVWAELTGERRRIALVPPFALEGEGEKVPGGTKFRRYKLVAGDGTYDLAVPVKDVELVRYALSR